MDHMGHTNHTESQLQHTQNHTEHRVTCHSVLCAALIVLCVLCPVWFPCVLYVHAVCDPRASCFVIHAVWSGNYVCAVCCNRCVLAMCLACTKCSVCAMCSVWSMCWCVLCRYSACVHSSQVSRNGRDSPGISPLKVWMSWTLCVCSVFSSYMCSVCPVWCVFGMSCVICVSVLCVCVFVCSV